MSLYSRRPSVKGGFPDRTDQLPHVTLGIYPELAGSTFNSEIFHSGWGKASPESHRQASGILNSLVQRSIETQGRLGPLRVVLHDVINPAFNTYQGKIMHMQFAEKIVGKPDVFFAVKPVTNLAEIHALIRSTKAQNREGVIVTSLTEPESLNVRFKIKHKILHNLKITSIQQEVSVSGELKSSMGSVDVVDASGRIVGRVGSGFSKLQREDAWKNPKNWVGEVIQVESMGIAKDKLRSPVYNGHADGAVDFVE